MFLGTSRWLWILSGVLVLLGLGGIASGNRFVGIGLLAAGLGVFAVAPTGPDRKNRRPNPTTPLPSSPPTATTVPPRPPVAVPERKPLDIEAGDPSQV